MEMLQFKDKTQKSVMLVMLFFCKKIKTFVLQTLKVWFFDITNVIIEEQYYIIFNNINLGGNMKKKLVTMFLAFAMILTCGFSLVACKKDNTDNGGEGGTTPPTPATPSSLLVELENDDYTLSDGSIVVTYGSKIELDADDFKVTLVYSDNTTAELNLKTETVDGFTFASTLPDDQVTPVGEYKLTFTYLETISSEVKVNVSKVNIDMSSVSWNYSEVFAYDGTPKTVELEGVPAGVVVTYENNESVLVGKYQAKATFAVADSSTQNEIAPMTLDWEIEKGTINLDGIYMNNYQYDGEEHEADLGGIPVKYANKLTYEFVAGSRTTATEAGTYEVEIAFNYTGEDADSYNAIENKTLTWKVNRAYVTVALRESKIYSGNEITVSASDFVTPEGITITEISGTTSGTAVGKYNIQFKLSYTDAAKVNYVVQEEKFTSWSIQKAPLTVTANNATITYRDDATNNNVSYSGFVNGENELTAGIIVGSLDFDTDYYKGANAGEYAIIPSGISSPNYEITFVNGVLTVEKADIDESKITFNVDYDQGGDVVFYYTAKNRTITLKNQTGVSLVEEWSGDRVAKNVGTYQTTVTVSIAASDAVNYNQISKTLTLDYEIVDIMNGFAVQYVSFENGEDSLNATNSVTIIDGVITGISGNFVNGYGDYSVIAYNDANLRNRATFTDLSVDKIYLLIVNASNVKFEVRELKVNYIFNATNLLIEVGKDLSANTEEDTYAVNFVENTNVTITTTLAAQEGTPAQSVELVDGVNTLTLNLTITLDTTGYNYTTTIVVTKSIDSDTYFTSVSFSDQGSEAVVASENQMSTAYTAANIKDFADSVNNGETIINVELDSTETAGYVVGTDEKAPRVEEIEGCFFLVVTLTADTSEPIQGAYRAVYGAGETLPDKYCYIRLYIEGKFDSNTNALILVDDVESGSTTIANSATTIEIRDLSKQNLNIKLENQYAKAIVYDANQTRIAETNEYGYVNNVKFATAGTYTLKIYATDKTEKVFSINVEGESVPVLEIVFGDVVLSQHLDNNLMPSVGSFDYQMNTEQSPIIILFEGYLGYSAIDEIVEGYITISELSSSMLDGTTVYAVGDDMTLLSAPYTNINLKVMDMENRPHVLIYSEGTVMGTAAQTSIRLYLADDPRVPSEDDSSTDVAAAGMDIFGNYINTNIKNETINLVDWNDMNYLMIEPINSYGMLIELYDNLENEPLQSGEGGLFTRFEQAGTYYIQITSADGENERVITLNVEGEFHPFMQIAWNAGTSENTEDDVVISEYFYGMGIPYGDFKMATDLAADDTFVNFAGYLGEGSAAFIITEQLQEYFTLTINSGVNAFIYDSIEAERVAITEFENITLPVYSEVIGSKTFKYVTLAVVHETTDEYMFNSYFTFKIYLDSKENVEAEIVYPLTLSLNGTNYDIKLKTDEWFDFGDLDCYAMNEYMYISTTRTALGLDASTNIMNATFTLPEAFDDESYTVLTKDGFNALKSGMSLEALITESKAFKATITEKTLTVPIEFVDGVAMVAILVDGGWYAVPLYIFIEDEVTEFENDDLQGMISYASKFNVSVTIGTETFSTANGDFASSEADSSNIYAYLEANRADVATRTIEIDEYTRFEVVDPTEISLQATGATFVDYEGNVVETDDVYFQIHNFDEFGLALHAEIVVEGVGEFQIVLVFADSTPTQDGQPSGPIE